MRAEKAFAPGKLARRTAQHASAISQIAENRRNPMRKSLREAIIETFDAQGVFRSYFGPEYSVTQRLVFGPHFGRSIKTGPVPGPALLVLNIKRLRIQPEHFLGSQQGIALFGVVVIKEFESGELDRFAHHVRFV